MPTRYTYSYHLLYERTERVEKIINTIGIGEEVISVLWTDTTNRTCRRILTSTGVILCQNVRTGMVTTMFAATLGQMRRIYNTKYIPKEMYEVFDRNFKMGLVGFQEIGVDFHPYPGKIILRKVLTNPKTRAIIKKKRREQNVLLLLS